jgi:hypothetical protein
VAAQGDHARVAGVEDRRALRAEHAPREFLLALGARLVGAVERGFAGDPAVTEERAEGIGAPLAVRPVRIHAHILIAGGSLDERHRRSERVPELKEQPDVVAGERVGQLVRSEGPHGYPG